ncbi:MAG: DUF5309 family protein [Muribaculaceae bacterium]|nr:DUF5309 family protein [Muribaculaceae bacterium]
MSNQANFVNGQAGGKHVSNAPLTTELAQQASPELLRNAIDSAVVKIRPMATPLDQISRLGHVRPVDSMEVDYYSVDTRIDSATVDDSEATANAAVEAPYQQCTLFTDTTFVEPSETIAWKTADGKMHTAYVTAKNEETLTCITDSTTIPAPGDKLIRMGRAATQLDVQSPQFSVLPRKNTNFCQIFKMQIEQSVIMKMSHKEIGWDFTDQQEAAIYDMRLGMEKQFLFGTRMKLFDPNKNETVMLTQGIWQQAGKELNVDLAKFDSKALVDLLRGAFTENSGSRRKILIAGSELISALNKIDAQRVITARDQVTLWGIDFSELCSKFGRLYVIFSDVFDAMGMPRNGIIVDPEYIQKHVFIPFTAETLDLRGSGQRNTEATVLTEASCLTLRYPEAHARVIGK